MNHEIDKRLFIVVPTLVIKKKTAIFVGCYIRAHVRLMADKRN